jgi:hypothetical protein
MSEHEVQQQAAEQPGAAGAAAETPEQALERWQAEVAVRQKALREDARAVMRAMKGWGQLQTQEEWEAFKAQAQREYRSGGFLLERLGAQRYLEPDLLAVLLGIRRELVAELGAASQAELLVVDAAVLAYHNLLRAQRWIGDAAIRLEHEFFGLESPTAKFRKEYGYGAVEGLSVEATAERLQAQLFPLLERANRMLLRNLKALREMRQAAAPSVQIGSAGQVNVAAVQANAAETTGAGQYGASATHP